MAQGKGPASCSVVVPLIWRAVTVWPCTSPGGRCQGTWGLWAVQSGLHPSAPHLPESGCGTVPCGHLQAPPEKKVGSPAPPALGLGRVLPGEALTGFCFVLLCKARAQEQSQWQHGSQLTRGETRSSPVPCECCCMRSRALPVPAAP